MGRETLVTETTGRVRRETRREARLEVLGVISIALGFVSIVLYFIPAFALVAWAVALPGAIVGAIDLWLGVSRRGYAIAGLTLSVVGLSYSFAAILWGSVG